MSSTNPTSKPKLYLIAIGGTGMRCLESFVHLCAAGMLDNETIEILTLDTDQYNGNKERVEALINLYNKVKTNDSANEGGEARANSFFSAKLNLSKFFTDYSTTERNNLKVLSDTHNLTKEQRSDNEDLSNLFFDRETVQEFSLDHGYRAQTHLGSMLMYHGIIESARNAQKGGKDAKEQDLALKKFLLDINNNANNAKVFVFGSVFGGTGASSIPVIPIALSDALKIITDKGKLNLDKVQFGSTLLTDYFSFPTPNNQQKENAKVIADSQNFALNSQAALQFYNQDTTVKNTYKRLYHIGWPGSLKALYGEDSQEVMTGGTNQRNDCHIVELMSAAAAYDFFTHDSFPNKQAEYFYRSVETDDNGSLRLTGASFMEGEDKATKLENRLGALFSLAHIILSKNNGAWENTVGTLEFRDVLKANNVEQYESLTDEQARQIDDYLKEFAYKVVRGRFIPGWIYQVRQSLRNGSFLFADQAFTTNVAELPKVDPGTIFLDKRHHWDRNKMLLFKDEDVQRLDKFYDLMKDPKTEASAEQGSTVKEKFLAHLYNAITVAQHYQQA